MFPPRLSPPKWCLSRKGCMRSVAAILHEAEVTPTVPIGRSSINPAGPHAAA
jgi:hypothetical protein